MKKVLILFAHPAIRKSKINIALRQAVEGLEHVTFHDLYATYPEFLIDVDREQALCEEHDAIIMQHPFYWYSSPAIIKEWQDLVLEYNWAYGSKASALEGKLFFQAITAGGSEDVYQRDGHNMFTVQELTAPFRATANLCRLNWLPPFAVLGVHRGISKELLAQHAKDYRDVIIALRDSRFDVEAARSIDFLNKHLDAIILKR